MSGVLESVTYSATVADATSGSTATPAGSVTFTIGSKTICTAKLSGGSGSCKATTAPVGTDTVNATYVPSADFTGSSGSTTLTVS
jgi:Bacterial Ig-like domain (group 3)